MRRKTDRDILKGSRHLAISSLVLILFGLCIILSPILFPGPDYDTLQEREVIIVSFRHSSGMSSSDYILTSGNEEYQIFVNADERSELRKALERGRRAATLKGYTDESDHSFSVREISMDGRVYKIDDPHQIRMLFLCGLLFIGAGAVEVLVLKYDLKRNRENQQKRDERIRRKYGKNFKDG